MLVILGNDVLTSPLNMQSVAREPSRCSTCIPEVDLVACQSTKGGDATMH